MDESDICEACGQRMQGLAVYVRRVRGVLSVCPSCHDNLAVVAGSTPWLLYEQRSTKKATSAGSTIIAPSCRTA